jgi:hypothetical protein
MHDKNDKLIKRRHVKKGHLGWKMAGDARRCVVAPRKQHQQATDDLDKQGN